MYQALYRKYRPSTFDDVISQPHITTTLKNQIISGKTAHAYLFTGSRGTGKTTCARIFAKSLICEHSADGNPCNECDICKSADSFSLSDIIEIDAASNGSVDDARELREAAIYTPERCKYKVYIIDEVHMLSKEAFNALLKIIEEPPAHVKFIMATTELHKVLPTILSRCQRFDFMRIKTEDIAARLGEIAVKENITLDCEAAELIAKTADGGMRDALSILDRCIAFSENITSDIVSEAAGIAGRGYLFRLAECIADKKPAEALDIISELYSRSKDMQKLCEELTTQLRNIMIAVTAPECTGIIVCLPSELEVIKRIAGKMSLDRIMACIEELGKCTERMSRSLSKRIDMEMCVIRLCNTDSGHESADKAELEKLRARIAMLEEQVRSGIKIENTAAPARPRTSGKPPAADMNVPAGTELVYIEKWQQVIERLKETCPSLAPVLFDSSGYISGNRLLINSNGSMAKNLINDKTKDYRNRVLLAVRDVTGAELRGGVAVGYRPEWDRRPDSMKKSDDTLPAGSDIMSSLLKKAEDGGVQVDIT